MAVADAPEADGGVRDETGGTLMTAGTTGDGRLACVMPLPC